MRHSKTTRRLVRSAASVRRAGRRAAGRGERPAPTAVWRSEPSLPGGVVHAGDSLASRFPAALLEELGPVVLRRGWAGETAVEMRARLDEILERDPRLLLLQTGTNDLLRGAAPDGLLTTYAGIMGDCRTAAPAVEVAIVGLPPVTAARLEPRTVLATNDGLRTLARATGALFVDIYGTLAARDGTPRSEATTDGVHLTTHGYRKVADLLVPAVAPYTANAICPSHIIPSSEM